jgi:hypothetical protein
MDGTDELMTRDVAGMGLAGAQDQYQALGVAEQQCPSGSRACPGKF